MKLGEWTTRIKSFIEAWRGDQELIDKLRTSAEMLKIIWEHGAMDSIIIRSERTTETLPTDMSLLLDRKFIDHGLMHRPFPARQLFFIPEEGSLRGELVMVPTLYHHVNEIPWILGE